MKARSNEVQAPFNLEKYSSKIGLLKIKNMEHRYEATKTQFSKKVDGAQSSIIKRPIPPKEINS
jgi:hypothetical protein